jgi:hypothetical protein
MSETKTGKLGKIIHPEFVIPDLEADKYTFYNKIKLSKIKKLKQVLGR